MAYTKSDKEANLRYFKDNQKRVSLNWIKIDYEKRIVPAIKKSGKPVSTFIKEAVEEKLVRDKLIEENSKYDLKYTLDKIIKTITKRVPRVFKDDCRQIILYGSCARGDYSKDSDVDVAILTNSNRIEVKKYDSAIDTIATDIGDDTMAVVNFVCLPFDEFEEKKSWYPYFKNIDKEGRRIYEY